jgi:carboxyl-terminal processing protease
MYEYKSRSHNFFLYIFIALLCFAFGWQASGLGFFDATNSESTDTDNDSFFDFNSVPDAKNNDKNAKADLSLFWTVWGELEGNYYDDSALSPDNMVYGAVKGMVESLDDPYTVFMTPDENKQFMASLEGTLEGIGAELTVEDKTLVIVSPLRDSPAERAGLLPSDIIFKIDSEIAADMTLFDAIMRIRGEKGSTVVLTILRDTLEDPFDVSIVRDSIDLESVTVEELDGGITYLSINQFNDKTMEELSKAISEMLLNEPKGAIIDLRYNGGGYLDIAVDMLSYFLPSHTEAVKIVAKGKDEEIMYTNGNPKLLNVPLVVLVNDGSASASEIVAGAIQDHERGIVMGTTTFGKGTVQEVETFSDGSSIRITIAKWLTPSGQDVNKLGLEPNIVVEITEEDIENEYDSQKESAVQYLKNL